MALALRSTVLATVGIGCFCLGIPVLAESLCSQSLGCLGSGQGRETQRVFKVARFNDDVQAVYRQAQAVTVRIFAGENRSSGILLQKNGALHTVLTNQHGLLMGGPYRVQTPDGQIHRAIASDDGSFASHDLALLQFRSPEVEYRIAKLGRALSLAPRTPVFAAGFPVAKQSASAQDFAFTTGQVSMITAKVLEGGYQLGYTNPIEKGMSGGPVLNLKGEVVAINGIHQDPLWGNSSYVFTDGSKPSATLQNAMIRSSWAIPSEVFVRALHALFPKN